MNIPLEKSFLAIECSFPIPTRPCYRLKGRISYKFLYTLPAVIAIGEIGAGLL
jgi:hypothetical protein